MEVVALQLIRQLQHIDQENEYVIFVKDGEDNTCIQETKNFKIVKVPGFTYADWEQVWFPLAVKREKLDVLHCTCNTSPVLFLNVPVLLTLHDIIFMESLSFTGTTYQNFGNLYRRLVVGQAVKKSSRVITVSNWEKENISRKLDKSSSKTEVVYNAVHEQFMLIAEEEELKKIRVKYQLPERFILYFSNTAPKKNTRGVLSAYGKYRKLAGENALPLVLTDSNQSFIKNLLEELHLNLPDGSLQILDFIPQHELPQFYNLTDLFLYPSLRESFGLPILEAMACGTPVITSSTSAMPEVAGDAALLCNPFDSSEIAHAMAEVLSDKDLYQSLVSKGLQRIQMFKWEMAARSVLSLYHTIYENKNNSIKQIPVRSGNLTRGKAKFIKKEGIPDQITLLEDIR